MKKQPSKLVLTRETLQNLTAPSLGNAAAGAAPTHPPVCLTFSVAPCSA
jgi:hypothetical protein